MTKDLDETLRTLGPECREAAVRLLNAREVSPRPHGACASCGAVRRPALLAASLAILVGGFAALSLRTGESETQPAVPREYALAQERSPEAIAELVRTQRADGGWANDFLTRRNAAALRLSTDAAAQLAYRKAVRNLRVRGLAGACLPQ